MANIHSSTRKNSLELDPSTQWTCLSDAVALIAIENQQTKQQTAATLINHELATLRPVMHDDVLIRSHEQAPISAFIRCALTPKDERAHVFAAETIQCANGALILLTIPAVIEWLNVNLPSLQIPTPWLKWMNEVFPALHSAGQTVSASDVATSDRLTLNRANIRQQTIGLKDAPAYLGITKYKFINEVRKHLHEVQLGKRGVGFYQLDLDNWSREDLKNWDKGAAAAKRQDKNLNGLFLRGSIWHIDKVIGGRRICRSTGTRDYPTAERVLAKLIGEAYEAKSFGARPDRTFAEASKYYLNYNDQKKSLSDDRRHIDRLLKYKDLAETPIAKLHRAVFDDFVKERQNEGVTSATINHALKVVRQMLNQAANDWRDDHGLTWLEMAPKIKLVPDNDKRAPRVLTWPEQTEFFALLPDHLRSMALFAVNTGCRESEICSLSWEWEKNVLNTSVFVLPKTNAKNGRSRVIIPNRIARECIESQRGKHSERVFTFRGKPIEKLNNSGWKTACKAAGLYNAKTGLRVHDLRHTAATRLRHAGVDEETRREILGHSSGRSMTNH